MSLHNEERPQDFSHLVQQESVKKTITAQLMSGKVKGAYLFSGVRGTGKTTVARIFSQSLNCEHPAPDGSPCGCCQSCMEAKNASNLDIYELDAASNNSVEDIHTILEQVQYRPIHKCKVFILDEVHMLSDNAFNALLKTLEEPPEHAVFILCTTEKHKIPATIISRCMCFDFLKISRDCIAERLVSVCESRNIALEKAAADIIAKAADGSMRDAYSILDRFMEEKHIDADYVSETLGITSDDAIFQVLNAISDKDPVSAINTIRTITERGSSLPLFIENTINTLLDMVEFQSTGDISGVIGSTEYKDNILQLSYKMDSSDAFRIMDAFRELYQLKREAEFVIISSIVSIIHETSEVLGLKQEIAELKMRLAELEKSGLPVCTNPGTTSAEGKELVSNTPSDKPDMTEELPDNIPASDTTSVPDTCNESVQENVDYDAMFKFREELPSQWGSKETASVSDISEDFTPTPDSVPFDEFMRSESMKAANTSNGIIGSDIQNINTDVKTTLSDIAQGTDEKPTEASWGNNFFQDEFARLFHM